MRNPYIALFPGQGSQSLGMLGEDSFSDEQDKKIILDCFSEASSVLGEDLWDITQNDADKINEHNRRCKGKDDLVKCRRRSYDSQ